MTGIAHELSRRARPDYIREQAREAVLNKTHEWNHQMTTSPLALGLIGGALGAAIGGSIAKSRRSSGFSGSYSPYRGYPGAGFESERFESRSGSAQTPGALSQAGTAVREKISDSAHDLRDLAGNAMDSVRAQIPSAAEFGEKAQENPAIIALGGLALGTLAALLLPVTRRERELLDPVKQKAGDALGQLGDKLGETVHQAQDKLSASRSPGSAQGDRPGSDNLSLPH